MFVFSQMDVYICEMENVHVDSAANALDFVFGIEILQCLPGISG